MIVLLGDCHGDFRELMATIAGYPQEEISGVFLLGDQTPLRPLEYELASLGTKLLARTWFILGNHDSDRPEYLKNHFGMWDRHLHDRVITVDLMLSQRGWGRNGFFMGTTMKTIWELPPMESMVLDWGFVSAWFGIEGCSSIPEYGKILLWFFQGEILHPGKGYNKDEGGISLEGPGLLAFCPRKPASHIRDLS